MIGHMIISKQTWNSCDCKIIWNICFPKEPGLLPRENSLFPEEGALLPKELGPFTKENLLLPKEVFFIKEVNFLH